MFSPLNLAPRKSGLTAVVLLMLLNSGAFGADVTAGLLGRWRLDEPNGDNTAVDSTGNGFTGTLNNFPATPRVPGIIGGALLFDGNNDHVRIPGIVTMTSGTYTAWIKTAGGGVGGFQGIIIKQGEAGIFLLDGRLVLYDWAANQTRDTGVDLRDDNWHHVAVTFQSGVPNGTILYIDGYPVLTTQMTNAFVTNLVLGAGGPTGGFQHFNGTIDDARVYNRVLTPTEITSLWSPPYAPVVSEVTAQTATTTRVIFSEPVTPATANVAANYSINDGVTISAATLQPDGRTVLLTTSALQPEVHYTLTASNVVDMDGSAMPAATQHRLYLTGVSSAGLIRHLTFDGSFGSLIRDASGNNNHGPPIDGAASGAGVIGQGLALDGLNDRVHGTVSAPFEYSGGTMTVSVWCNLNATETDGGWLYSKPWNGGGGYNYTMYLYPDRRVQFELVGATGFGIISPTGISTGGWHNIVSTVDAARVMRLYIDGVQVVTNTHNIVSWAHVNGDTDIVPCIGSLYPYGSGWAGNTTFSIAGSMDDVRVYNRVLTATEVATLASSRHLVSLAAIDPTAAEPATTGTYRVSRTGDLGAAATVPVLLSGTATPGDYMLSNVVAGNVTIAAGQSFTDVVLTPIDDTTGEPSETLTLIMNPTVPPTFNRLPPTAGATVTIADDEPALTLVASQPTASERGPTPGVFTITRSVNTAVAVTATYTLTGTAQMGSDYENLSGSVAFAPGQTIATILINPLGDAIIEPNETVILTLTVAAGYYNVPPGSATVTLTDKATVTVSASDPDAYEVGPDAGVFTFTRTGDTTEPLTVPLTIGGTAVAGGDYVALSGFAIFQSGQTTTTLQVLPIDNTTLGTDTTVTVALVTNTEFAAGTPNSALVIIHTDPEIFGGSGGLGITPNPAVAGMATTFSAPTGNAAVVSWLWTFGDGSTSTALTTTHTYINPGIYQVIAAATLADGTVSIGVTDLFVSVGLTAGVAGAGAIPTGGSGGVLVGGSGAVKSGSAKLKVQFTKRAVVFSGGLNHLAWDKYMDQASLLGRQGSVKIGSGAGAPTFFFVLNGSGNGRGQNVPSVNVNLKRKSFKFRIDGNQALLDYLNSIGASRTAPRAVLNVPVQVQVADKIFLAIVYEMTFKLQNDTGLGTLRK